MAIKFKITKADYDALTDEQKAFYAENASRKGEYVVDLEPDFNKELTTAHERVKADKTILANKVTELETELTTERAKQLDKNGAVSKADHDAMKASYDIKIAKDAKDAEAKLAKKDTFIRKTLVDSKATELATKISKVPALMARLIKDRLTVDLDGDEPKTVVLDSDGKPSAFTLDDLQQEFVANKEYADIIVGSKATGGNAHPVQGGGNALNGNQPPSLSALDPQQLVAHMKATHKDL